MSSRRLQDDYRRILGITEDVRGIDPALPRMRIAGARGIYQQGDGTTKSGSSPSGDGSNPITPTEDDRNITSGGFGGGNPFNVDGVSGGNNEDQGWSVIDPDDPLVPNIDPFDDTFGSGWATGGPITFQDCETGKCIEIVETGGYVPPDGWDDADTPPIDPTYQEGYLFRLGVGGAGTESLTPAGVCALSGAYPNYCTPEQAGNTYGSCSTASGCGGAKIFIDRRPCSAFPDVCDQDPPVISEFWPADNCIQLTPNAEGNLAPSSRENPNDMTAKYSEAKSQLTLCNSSGELIQINKNVHGGLTYLNLDQSTWRSTDAHGKPIAFGSSSTHKFEIQK